MHHRKLSIALHLIVLSAFIGSAAEAKSTKADQAPPPPAVPVPQVDQAPLVPPGPDKVEGTAVVIDGDEIRIGDSTVRLYGIAAPDLTTRLGPAARVALDAKVNGQRTSCLIFGKTPDGDPVGQCKVGDADPAAALLGQGLAAVYRSGNANDTSQQALAQQYDAAEAIARQQGIGIWAKDPAPAAANQEAQAAADQRRKQRQFGQIVGIGGFALLILGVFSIPLTLAAIARKERKERARLRHARRFTLSSGMAAEAEIIRAAVHRNLEQIATLPADRPVPSAFGTMLGLPTATYWNANAERLAALPAEVTIPLLRLHALHEEAVRKLAIASAIPTGTVAGILGDLDSAAGRAIAAIEASLGLKRDPAEKASSAGS